MKNKAISPFKLVACCPHHSSFGKFLWELFCSDMFSTNVSFELFVVTVKKTSRKHALINFCWIDGICKLKTKNKKGMKN